MMFSSSRNMVEKSLFENLSYNCKYCLALQLCYSRPTASLYFDYESYKLQYNNIYNTTTFIFKKINRGLLYSPLFTFNELE